MEANVEAAIAAAREDKTCSVGLCLTYVVDWWMAPLIGATDAFDSWKKANTKHPGDRNPPRGAPVYYSGGKHGHVALSLGGGRIRTTDAPSDGKVSEQKLDWPEKAWTKTYLGWTGDLGHKALPLGAATSLAATPAGAASAFASGDVFIAKLRFGQLNSDSVKRLQFQLNRVHLEGGADLPITGNYLDDTDKEVRLWQAQVAHDPADQPHASSLGPLQAAKMFPSPPYKLH